MSFVDDGMKQRGKKSFGCIFRKCQGVVTEVLYIRFLILIVLSFTEWSKKYYWQISVSYHASWKKKKIQVPIFHINHFPNINLLTFKIFLNFKQTRFFIQVKKVFESPSFYNYRTYFYMILAMHI